MASSVWAEKTMLICDRVEGKKDTVVLSYHFPLKKGEIGFREDFKNPDNDKEFFTMHIETLSYKQNNGSIFLHRYDMVWDEGDQTSTYFRPNKMFMSFGGATVFKRLPCRYSNSD